MTNFDIAYEFTRTWEGGYVNNSNDPGGETNRGITDKQDGKIDGKVDVDGDGVGDALVKDLTNEQAKKVYERRYWNAIGAGGLSLADAIAAFDTCVNCGVARTTLWLDVSKDWKDLLEYRRKHNARIIEVNPKLKVFEKGWNNRLNALHKYIIQKTESKV